MRLSLGQAAVCVLMELGVFSNCALSKKAEVAREGANVPGPRCGTAGADAVIVCLWSRVNSSESWASFSV